MVILHFTFFLILDFLYRVLLIMPLIAGKKGLKFNSRLPLRLLVVSAIHWLNFNVY